jgi:small subunit ribosomal protein S18
MGRNASPNSKRSAARSAKDAARRATKKKVCSFCADRAEWVDYKDVNLLRRFMSDRGKIKARRVSGNCVQHQRDVATAIKTARELALLPYSVRASADRAGGRGRGGRGRRDESAVVDGSEGATAREAEIGAEGDGLDEDGMIAGSDEAAGDETAGDGTAGDEGVPDDSVPGAGIPGAEEATVDEDAVT